MKLICHCTCSPEQIEIEWDGVSSYQLKKLLVCPKCGKTMEVEENKTKPSEKLSTIMTPTIDSMTPAQRKALLKERSNRDFKKNVEFVKRDMDKNVIPK